MSTAAEAARQEIEQAKNIWEIAAMIGTFANDPPDSQYQLIYLRTLVNEFQKQIATYQLPK